MNYQSFLNIGDQLSDLAATRNKLARGHWGDLDVEELAVTIYYCKQLLRNFDLTTVCA